MTDEQVTAKLTEIIAEARRRVPQWQPWMRTELARPRHTRQEEYAARRARIFAEELAAYKAGL